MEDGSKIKKNSKYLAGGAVLTALIRLFVSFGILPSLSLEFPIRFLLYIIPTMAIAFVFSLIIRSILEEDGKMKYSFDYFAITYLAIEALVLIGAVITKFFVI